MVVPLRLLETELSLGSLPWTTAVEQVAEGGAFPGAFSLLSLVGGVCEGLTRVAGSAIFVAVEGPAASGMVEELAVDKFVVGVVVFVLTFEGVSCASIRARKSG